AADVGGGQGQQLALAERLDARRTDLAVEHRELAEDIPWPEVGERDRPPVGMLAGHPEGTGADDEAGVGMVYLVKHPRRLRIATPPVDAREAIQLLLVQLREQGDPAEELDGALLGRHHTAIITQGRPELRPRRRGGEARG